LAYGSSAASNCGVNEYASRSIGLLIAELAAIEFWDAQLWLNGPPRGYEIVAFVLRRYRHSQIIRQMADITPEFEKPLTLPWSGTAFQTSRGPLNTTGIVSVD
jgi:hypothetical protein